jgi:transposase
MPTFAELAQLGRQALLAFVSRLLVEVATLKTRLGELASQVGLLTTRLDDAALQIFALKIQVNELAAENAAFRARLEQQDRDAHRHTAPFSKGQRKPNPKRPGRKPGRGPFTFRTLPTPDQCTAPPIEVRIPDPVCPCCGEPLLEDHVDFAATTDIPPRPEPIVQPYRVWVYRCPSCKKTVRASHPDLAADQAGATAHRMGPRVMAAAHATHYGLGVPVRKIPAVLQLFTGVRLTQSAITQDAMRRAAGPIGQAYEELRARVPDAAVVYTDDTGWRVGGKPAQLMIFETDAATVFQVRDQHRNEEVREVIGDAYAGVLVTDRGKSYDARELEGVKQQKCIPHVLRSIHKILETQQDNARDFGTRLKELLKTGLALWHERHDAVGGVIGAGWDERVAALKAEVTEHLKPRALGNADDQRLLKELGRHHARGNLLRFLDDPRVEPTNNRSERGLRFGVIQRKVSQCSKTVAGAYAFAAFASVIRTTMKHGGDVVERLCALFKGDDAREAPS